MSLREWVVKNIYADHGNSRCIQSALKRCIDSLDSGTGLNVGSASSWHRSKIINLDICPGPLVDCVGDAQQLPFRDDAFKLVITQEALEHIADPEAAMGEIARVLAPGGVLYCQLPFIIGYHPGPHDFWRFTKEGIRKIVERHDLEVNEIGQSIGPAFGIHRIATEFWAVLISRLVPRAYKPAKGLFALLLYPIKWTDRFLMGSPEADRIAGGYFVIAQKRPGGPRESTRETAAERVLSC